MSDRYQVIGATTGQAGLAQAKTQRPDLILLDMILPDLAGLAVLKRLKANAITADIPVVVLTNLTDQATIGAIVQAGGKDYLVKTDWSLEEIAQKIRATLH